MTETLTTVAVKLGVPRYRVRWIIDTRKIPWTWAGKTKVFDARAVRAIARGLAENPRQNQSRTLDHPGQTKGNDDGAQRT